MGLDYIHALLLGIIEGLTEFIPVSSTGHLILLVDIIGFNAPPGKTFEIVIQLGAILAICYLYREKFWRIAIGLHKDKDAQHFCLSMAIAFLPSAVLGALFHSFIKEVLFSPIVVSVSLVIGGIIIIIVEKLNLKPRYHHADKVPLLLAFKIGLAQTLAMIPGTSRSGATIIGSMLLGLDRKAATEFSFFLAVPTMLGATVYDLYKNYEYLSVDNALLIATGFISAFISALFVVKTLVNFVSNHGFTPFAYYRIVIGSTMLIIFLL